MPFASEMPPGVPSQVTRVQEALTAKSRLLVLKCLTERPMTFAELTERLPQFSATAVRAAIWDLDALGYVSDDSDPGRQRRSKTAYYSVDRDLVLRDVAELLLFLSR